MSASMPGSGVSGATSAVNGYGQAHAGAPSAAGASAASGRRPEIAVGAAFAGGLLLAALLRKIRS